MKSYYYLIPMFIVSLATVFLSIDNLRQGKDIREIKAELSERQTCIPRGDSLRLVFNQTPNDSLESWGLDPVWIHGKNGKVYLKQWFIEEMAIHSKDGFRILND